MIRLLLALLVLWPAAAQAEQPSAVLERAIEAHGGDLWLRPGTLRLEGRAVFYAPDSATPRSEADDYRMWRVFDPERADAHEASGKVRIVARAGKRTIFEVGYDGATTWTQDGVMPKPAADAYWASNFGFGVLRAASGDGFAIEPAPPREIGGRAVSIIRIIDPAGNPTLFGIDAESGFIRYLAFDSPRGFHERHYDDFVRLENGWVQAREVTLFYDGVKANTVFWREIAVGEPIDAAVFAPPTK